MKWFLIGLALITDTLQFIFFFIFLALQWATPYGSGAAGALGGGYICWTLSGGIVEGITNGAACAVAGGVMGAAASAFAVPLGAAVGYFIGITFGSVLVLGLAWGGMFYPDLFFRSSVFKVIPILSSFVPAWTIMVRRCIKRHEQGGLKQGSTLLSTALGLLPGGDLVQKVANVGVQAANINRGRPQTGQQTPEEEEKQKNSPRTPLLSNRFADIKPAMKGAALALLLCLGLTAHAQAVPPPIQYVVNPEVPGPHESVTIEVQGVGSFLGSATLAWTQDGKTVKEGVGERRYTFVTGNLGEKTTIKVSTDSSQGFFTQTFSFTPSRINLLWEADTTVPPFYTGKALYSAGSLYKVVAFPTVYSGGARVLPQALSYQWTRNGDAVPEQSGLGRNTFSYAGDQLQAAEDVGVEVYYGNNRVGRAAISIPTSNPQVLFYQYDALRGTLYDAALPEALSLVGKEITVKAEPYFFSTTARNQGAIPFVWTLNQQQTTGPDAAQGLLTLRQAGSGEGVATLGVSVQNSTPDQFVQTAQRSLQLVFGAQSSTPLLNLFGL